MISCLSGKIKLIAENYIIVDLGNIGYRVYLTPVTFAKLPKVGEPIELYTYTYVREDALNLYGFLTYDELDFFETVISVTGVGPKAGLGVLSAAAVPDIKRAIAEEDISVFTRVPGIGRKTAERIILELKGKVEVLTGKARSKRGDVSYEDAISALVKLGISTREAEMTLSQLPKELSEAKAEEKIRWALKNLGKR